ncbi:uncharacterized protein EHS24_005560 [Apiotrichum porosum]|uniref:Uncharacterized protein n=1 Tax=Apiotrichum porosum TaxID=105984 RepID=A0A427XCF9_9TREE|nr:uncharacterized protein EHS24_005560 [Apiotrichum porosum]RSH76571.1 hypothetical protein EHS24_005560 [Apiotrichum porosum]
MLCIRLSLTLLRARYPPPIVLSSQNRCSPLPPNHEYDISIVSLGSVQTRTTVSPPGFTGSTLERASATVHKFLDSVSREKFRNLPSSAATPFTPLIFSLGGVMEHRTAQALHTWGEVLPPHSHRMLCIRLSLTLLRARVRNFDLWSH